MKKTLAVLFATLMYSGISLAQDTEDEWLPYCKKAVNIVVNRIQPHLTTEIAEIAKTTIVVSSTDFNAGAFRGKVFISTGICFELVRVTEALIYSYKHPEFQNRFLQYGLYLANVRKQEELHKPKSPLKRLNFEEYIGKKLPALTQKDVGIMQSTFLDGLTLMVSHELSHHSLGHLKSPPTSSANSKFRELKADDFAIDILKKLRVDVGSGQAG